MADEMGDGQGDNTGEAATGELVSLDLGLSARHSALHCALEVVKLMPSGIGDPAEVVLGTADRFHAWLTQDNPAAGGA